MTTFETPEPITITLEVGVGDVRVVAEGRTDTLVEVKPSNPSKKGDVAAAEQTQVEYAAGRLLVKAPKGWRRFAPWGGGGSIDVHIEVPEGSHIRGEAAVASLHCSGRLGECRYKTSVGDIYVEEAGPVELRTVAGNLTVDRAVDNGEFTAGSGDVAIGAIEGNAVVKNSNGGTWVGIITGSARVNSANGRVVVDRADAGVAAKTANGDIRLGEVARGEIVAETAYGSIDIRVRSGVPAWLDISTSFGTVRNELDDAERPETGEEAVEVRAQTSFGDVTVARTLARSHGKEDA